MNAQELTIVVNKQGDRIRELEKQNEYLTQEAEKLRRFVDDMKIDIKMLSASIDALRRR